MSRKLKQRSKAVLRKRLRQMPNVKRIKGDKPRPPIVVPSERDKSPGEQLAGLIIRAGAQLRKHIKWDNNGYHFSYGANGTDPRGYYLYGVLNEVEKACFSMILTADWVKDSEKTYDPNKELDQEQRRITDNLCQSKIDELSVWQRKMTELMVALVGFREANEQDYYRHFLALHELQHLNHSRNDLAVYYGMRSENYAFQQTELHELIGQTVNSLDVTKVWYAEKRKDGALGSKIDSFANRFQYSFEKMEEQLRATLRTQYLSFGLQSRNVHVGTTSGERNLKLDNISTHVLRIGTLAIHVIVLVKQLLDVQDKGAIATCEDIVYKNEYPVELHRRRTDPDIQVGDFVLASWNLGQVIKVNVSERYGFKSFRVRFLDHEPLPGITEDEFVGEHVRLLFKRGTSMVDQTLEMIKRVDPNANPDPDEINKGICEGVVLEWHNGLKECALGQPGGKEKLEAFRQQMDEKVAPLKKMMDERHNKDEPTTAP
jgi:hypothetical protein